MHHYIHILETKKWSRLLVHVLSWTKVISFYSVSKFSVIILFIQLLILILKEKIWIVEILTSTLETLHKSGLSFTNCHIRPFVIKFFLIIYSLQLSRDLVLLWNHLFYWFMGINTFSPSWIPVYTVYNCGSINSYPWNPERLIPNKR